MRMFASDLDRTLIYSNKALADFGQTGKENLIAVESKDGREVAFMTNEALMMLKEVSAQMLFVPVTTRTYEQYKRIFIFQDDLNIPYTITSNGANIHYQGKPLEEWFGIVRKRLMSECALLEEMMDRSQCLELNGKIKTAENLFFYYILNEQITTAAKEEIVRLTESYGWRISLQGRKLYFMPNPICKGEAVKFIKNREGINNVFGAGDSVLDHDFLKFCDFPYVPNHGELAANLSLSHPFLISKNIGAAAGEEILNDILNSIQERV
ncbi:HAD family hydrolase [Cytobacillus firmus]|uniref:HAD family hydrolase n=1 Tax=Cytobacillus firmus TaxID=1399 RepID=UPI0022282369|nr:HAD family hydrolase [Cytobacillus firmus]